MMVTIAPHSQTHVLQATDHIVVEGKHCKWQSVHEGAGQLQLQLVIQPNIGFSVCSFVHTLALKVCCTIHMCNDSRPCVGLVILNASFQIF